jgi:hypothetical protein
VSLAHWEDQGDPWDVLKLGDHIMPGIWEVTSGQCERQVDHKKTKDKDGARIKDMGLLPPRFSARGRMVTREHWNQMQEIMPDINPRKRGGTRFPLAIFHPAVSLLGVTTIYVERVRAPEIKDGMLEIAIDMIEWTAEPKTTKTKDRPAGNAALTQREANALVGGIPNWSLRIAGIGGEITPDSGATQDQFARVPPGTTTPDAFDESLFGPAL